MKYLEDFRLTQLTSDLTEAFLNTRGSGSSVGPSTSSSSHPNSRGRGGNRGGSKAKKQQQQYQQQQKHAHQQSTSRAKKSRLHTTHLLRHPTCPPQAMPIIQLATQATIMVHHPHPVVSSMAELKPTQPNGRGVIKRRHIKWEKIMHMRWKN